MNRTSTPWSWHNWKEKRIGKDVITAVELRLYSDSWFIGEQRNLGPYNFLNPVPLYRPGGIFTLKPAIVLRVDVHAQHEIGDLSITDDTHYHGGTSYDEIAALASLVLGARIKAAPIDREFTDRDPYGTPMTYESAFEPGLPVTTDVPQIPSLNSERNLGDLQVIKSLPDLDREDAVTLIKCARLYQIALWSADATPEISWILLVSAIETAATRWDGQEHSAMERLEISFPQIVEILKNNPDTELTEKVATHLEGVIGSTSKFMGFMKRFKPNPPIPRPTVGAFDFGTNTTYTRAMKKIYRYRSRALHGGIPFPNPMCRPPMVPLEDSIPSEIPFGLSSGSLGSTWRSEDTPMLLHLYSYIVQQSLLLWWRDIA